MTYYLLEATQNDCIRDFFFFFFFTINLFSLINGEVILFITVDPTVELNNKETVSRSSF